MKTVTIKSSITSATLTFSDKVGDYFTVTYESDSVTLKRKVWGYTDCQFLVELFSFIAENWKGWSGAQDWSSIEGELKLSATSDKLGHVNIETTIKEFDQSENWKAVVNLKLDSAQTTSIANQVTRFFND